MPRNLRPPLRRMAEGISAYDTWEAAEAIARARRGKIGSFIAEMTVTESGAITYELTGDNGHYTLWGDPEVLSATVGRVAPIEGMPLDER